MRWSAKGLMLAFAAVCMIANAPAFALDPTRSIDQMYHRAFTREHGITGAVTGIAQTEDGYLWVATNGGLFRFDGVHFERFAEDQLLSRNILSLAATASGDLWIGYYAGGVGRLRDG